MAKRAQRVKRVSEDAPQAFLRTADVSQFSSPREVNIFISYASEDKELAGAVENVLRKTFAFAPLQFFRDVEIKLGTNWVNAIDTALDTADILLVLFTERMKVSHSYTGYEIGFFNKSRQQRPQNNNGQDRIYLPLCVGAEIPETMHFVQGIKIDKADVVKVIKTSEQVIRADQLDNEHPIYKLLERISNLVAPPKANREDVDRLIGESAADLYKAIHGYLQSRVSSESFPERKIIIRTDDSPPIGQDGADLTKATFELVGKSFDIFGISEGLSRELSWDELSARLNDDLTATCLQGIRRLVGDVIQNAGENYCAVTSVNRDKAFRLFVSRIVTYVSKKTEIHIYFVEMRSKKYGDRLTTQLLEAISVGMRFRFLVLEETSEFRPGLLGYVTMEEKDLKPRVGELLAQMDLLIRDAEAAQLRDPKLLEMIWGKGKDRENVVKEMVETWTKARDDLYAAARNVLLANSSTFNGRKAEFIQVLQKFSDSTEVMNREYTSRAMELLGTQIKQRLDRSSTSSVNRLP